MYCLQPDLGARHVLSAHDRAAVLAGAQDDVLVLRGSVNGRCVTTGKVSCDRRRRRLLADLAGAEQRVLACTACWMSLVVMPSEAMRSGFIQMRIAWSGTPKICAWPAPWHALERIEHVDVGVVGDVVGAVAPVLAR